jgi:ABC-2 type transport system permease protein
MMKNKLQGYGFLNKLNFRRDRFNGLIWLVVLAGLMASVAFKFEGLYGTAGAIQSIKTTLDTAAMKALFGAFNTSLKTSGDVFATEMLVFMAIMMIVMNIYFAVKISRSEEDKGLVELISAHAIGKNAIFAAASTELVVLNLLTGILFSLGIQFSGMKGIDANGAWLIGISLGMVGLLFGAIGLLMAQLFDNSRSATIASYLIFGVMYIARMNTDVQNPHQTWWIPMGWIEKINAFHQNNWLPVIMLMGLSLVIWIIALWNNQTRDIGAGLISVHAGRQKASWWLRGPITLIERLQRHSTIIWIIGLFILGVTYGSIFNTIGDILKTNPTMQSVFGKAAVQSANHQILLNFISVISVVMVTLATLPAVLTLNKVRSDTDRGYLENVYAKSVSRSHILTSYLLNALVVGIVGLVASLLGIYLAGNAVLDHGEIEITTYLHVLIAFGPVLLLTIGLAVFLNGLLPRWNWITWIYLGYGFFASYLGGLIKLPEWAKKLNGLGWTHSVPLYAVNYSYVVVMLVIAVILIVIGYVGFNRRDLN